MNEVVKVIRESGKLYKGRGFLWFEEVRSRTGYPRARAVDPAHRERERYADALIVSLFPSRGCWFAGIEVKTQRADFLREMRDVSKARAIKRYCRYWWLACTPNVMHPSEVPSEWGVIEIAEAVDSPLLDNASPFMKQRAEDARVKILRRAPKLMPEPVSMTFVASLLRTSVK